MKHPSVASPESEEDDVSDCTMSCTNCSALRQALKFSKVTRKGKRKVKEEELERLLLDERQEGMGSKQESIVASSELKEDKVEKEKGSRLRLLLVSIPILLSCLWLFLSYLYPLFTPQPLLQSEVQLANGMNKTFEKNQAWIGDLEKALKIAERKMSEFEQINHDQADNIMKYAHYPFSIEELVAKVNEATELQIESKLQAMAEMMIGKMNEAFFKHHTNTSRIPELEKASQVIQPTMVAEKEECVVLKNLQSNWTEKCSKQIMASEEMNATANESMSKKNMAHVLVQEDKETAEEAGAKRKGEMDSHFELLMELVRNVSQAQENCSGALNILQVDENEKDETELSLQEALQKILNLEKKMEEAGKQSAREIEEAMAEMKGVMKTQGEEMTQIREEKDAALESKLTQTKLSLQEALQKISNLENKALPLSVWKSSGTKLVSHRGSSVLNDVLNCAPLKSGTFEWKIQAHTASSYNLLLGVIGSSLKLPLDCWIGFTKKTWGYWSNGGKASYLNEEQKVIHSLPVYTSGSVVHFVLDLTNKGTLCVSVDGSPLVEAFSNMKSLIDNDEGFLPAMSMYHTNKIELLEFKCR